MTISYRTDTLDIAQLDLDLQNPRGNPTSNQTHAMKELLAVEGNGEKVFVLALSICERGMLDPGDRIYVIEISPGRYTVLDGNRRLTALRLLSQYNLVDREELQLSSQMRSRFKKLQSKYPGAWPQKADVVVFESRESANLMIRLRHTGENEGAGRSSWSALQVARFDNAPSWRAISQLREREMLELHTLNRLSRGDFAITNFERVAGTDRFKTLFGASLASFQQNSVAVPDRALAALAKLANDVASGRVTSRDEFEKEEKMGDYLDEVNRAVLPAENEVLASNKKADRSSRARDEDRRGGGSQSRDDSNSEDSREGGNGHSLGEVYETAAEEGKGRTYTADGGIPYESGRLNEDQVQEHDRDPDLAAPKMQRRKAQTKYLVERKTSLVVTDQKCRDILDELKGKVIVENAPYACALLLRSLLEITGEIYSRDVLKRSSNTIANLDAMANDLRASSKPGEPSDRKELAIAFASASKAYSNLSSAAHDQYHVISPAHVRATWSTLSGGMDLAWKRIAAANFNK